MNKLIRMLLTVVALSVAWLLSIGNSAHAHFTSSAERGWRIQSYGSLG